MIQDLGRKCPDYRVYNCWKSCRLQLDCTYLLDKGYMTTDHLRSTFLPDTEHMLEMKYYLYLDCKFQLYREYMNVSKTVQFESYMSLLIVMMMMMMMMIVIVVLSH